MKMAVYKVMFAATPLMAIAPLMAADAVEDEAKAKAHSQFEALYGERNDDKNALVKKAIDRSDLTRRVYSVHALDAEIKKVFDDDFWNIVGGTFFVGNPYANSKDDGTIVDFEFQDGDGRAVVRYRLPQHNFAYQVWHLRNNSRGRLKVVDRFDAALGQLVTADLSEQLSLLMPSRSASRRLLSTSSPSDTQIFQVTEILKAARDKQGPRFFEIYDDLDARTQRLPLIAKHAMKLVFALQDADRFRAVLQNYVAVNENNPDVALIIANSYFSIGDYANSYAALEQFHQHINLNEGAIPARLSALALALGKNDAAEAHAKEATSDEPGLELGWWSLLRARAQLGDFAGAIEPLGHLEDDFGHTLDAANLRRDRFRGFLALSESDAFKEWRGTR